MIPCTATDFAGFSDNGRSENNNAVRMLYDLGLISGYSDGSFGRRNYIRREEVAKLMALLCEAERRQASRSFYDSTTSWAADYSPTAPSTTLSPAAAGASARRTM